MYREQYGDMQTDVRVEMVKKCDHWPKYYLALLGTQRILN